MTPHLTARDLTKSYDGRLVLDCVGCSVRTGERLGIVGENGSGKSTLLRLLAGAERPDSGEVVLRSEGGVGYLPQEEDLPPHLTVQQVIDRALTDLRTLQRQLRRYEARMADGDATAGTLTAYADALTAFELRGGYDADARVERALHGLGLPDLPRGRPVAGLSGGETVRLRLAVLLAADPEVLLLDEPTNHLDGTALTWLEAHLRARRGITVAVSHDRTFLEHVATCLLEVDGDLHQAVRYGNGYAGYLAQRAADRRRRAEAHNAWKSELDRLRESTAVTARRVAPGRAIKDGNKMAYDRAAGRVQQSLASRVRNAEERITRLLARPVPAPADPLRFTGAPRTAAASGHAGPRQALLAASGVAVEGRLAPVDVTVPTGGRLLVTGSNGAGKSTLLHVLAGALTPDRGQVHRRGHATLLTQQTSADADRRILLAAYAEGRPGTREEHTEQLLSLGLFTRERLIAPVASLSVGQRRRLALARILTEPADVLLLDEPTNHLSPALAEELQQALLQFPGAVVLVSHDRRLCDSWQGDRHDLTAPADAEATAKATVTTGTGAPA
ncbi:ABC-F family ATP-binding cassette domain-containing protein [Streptomyces sp. 549]|uniref:ABC-F family ATP-binding cassette domain-containing protein n=1 Tax=Streptomyces sp. 549 TaxID=3049076 RepID=UPI0024C23D90|nr:ABC-F family ATP-binding cassette domain-containing protein [Streptomyces sp. 549]MDK1476949.1 ABC-F family ATP-binding cassette domain-containing protein [Streptomyces sp. 549]